MRNLVLKTKKALGGFSSKAKEVINNERGDIGIGTALGVVIVVIVFAFIVLPQSRSIALGFFTDMGSWIDGLSLFPTS